MSSTKGDPATLELYNARSLANQRLSGFGITKATQHFPCPFCAAPDWAAVLIIDTAEVLAQEHTCKECGRTGKCQFRRTADSITFCFVQTGGTDAPAYLRHLFPRVAS